MKSLTLSLLIAFCAFSALGMMSPESSRDPLRVVATVPDLADIAGVIGGERVKLTSLAKGSENLHNVRVRPSMMVAVRKADVFLQAGLSLESTWIPSLLLSARNSKIAPDQPGFVNCSEGWEAIQIPESLSRKGGDLHPQGNPHFNLDPRSGTFVAKRICEALQAVDPEGAEFYARRLEVFEAELVKREARWQLLIDGMKGKRVAAYHQEFNYMAKYAGLEVAVSIEPKPGIPPTPGDVARVLRELEKNSVDLILTAAWSNNRTVADIARKSGATVLELPSQVNGASWANSWVEMIDGNLVRLRKALSTLR